MKVSDLIARWLKDMGIRHVFTVSGGADLHIIHSIAKTEGLRNICPQSEMAAGFAADAYARLTGFGCALATSGPGATNLITAIAASYYESVPVLYLTGNQTVARMNTHGTRQYGFQATPICELVRPVTKLAVQVLHASQVLEVLRNAYEVATAGRKGPVLVDFPDDIQRAHV